ncbi:MAG: TVP38/TMEM64 family protein [Spirochaetaceae bacterium]|nr:TVP38/TMEM64 family protein [Spirochaetaceae bacterium]
MTPSERPRSRLTRVLSIVGYPALFAALGVVAIVFWEPVLSLMRNPEELRVRVEAYGVAAPAVFIAVQVLQVVVFVIPGEFPQLAAGYLFGIPLGIVLTLGGAALGSAIGFLLARLLGRPFLHAIVSEKRSSQVEDLIASPRGVGMLFLLYLIPGIPKDVLCYVAGIGPLRLGVYLLASTVGRLPGVAVSVISGDAAAERQWAVVAIALGIAVVFFVVGFLLRRRLMEVLQRFARLDELRPPAEPRPPDVPRPPGQPGRKSATAATPAGRSARRKPR